MSRRVQRPEVDLVATLRFDSTDLARTEEFLSHHAAEPVWKRCLCGVHSGGIVRRYFPDGTDGTEGTFGAGDVFVYAPHDRPYAGVIQGARYNLVMFAPRLLDQVAATARGRGSGPVRLTGDRPASPAAARHSHTTRFTSSYQDQYGALPSHTLHA